MTGWQIGFYKKHNVVILSNFIPVETSTLIFASLNIACSAVPINNENVILHRITPFAPACAQRFDSSVLFVPISLN